MFQKSIDSSKTDKCKRKARKKSLFNKYLFVNRHLIKIFWHFVRHPRFNSLICKFNESIRKIGKNDARTMEVCVLQAAKYFGGFLSLYE